MRKVNITLEMDDAEIPAFEYWLRDNTIVTDFTLLSDTKELYENDNNFRQLCMKVKAAKRVRNDYINKHNFK